MESTYLTPRKCACIFRIQIGIFDLRLIRSDKLYFIAEDFPYISDHGVISLDTKSLVAAGCHPVRFVSYDENERWDAIPYDEFGILCDKISPADTWRCFCLETDKMIKAIANYDTKDVPVLTHKEGYLEIRFDNIFIRYIVTFGGCFVLSRDISSLCDPYEMSGEKSDVISVKSALEIMEKAIKFFEVTNPLYDPSVVRKLRVASTVLGSVASLTISMIKYLTEPMIKFQMRKAVIQKTIFEKKLANKTIRFKLGANHVTIITQDMVDLLETLGVNHDDTSRLCDKKTLFLDSFLAKFKAFCKKDGNMYLNNLYDSLCAMLLYPTAFYNICLCEDNGRVVSLPFGKSKVWAVIDNSKIYWKAADLSKIVARTRKTKNEFVKRSEKIPLIIGKDIFYGYVDKYAVEGYLTIVENRLSIRELVMSTRKYIGAYEFATDTIFSSQFGTKKRKRDESGDVEENEEGLPILKKRKKSGEEA